MNISSRLSSIRSKVTKKQLLGGVVVLALTLFGIALAASKGSQEEVSETESEVASARVETITIGQVTNGESVRVVGTVESEAETDLRAQTGGEVTSVRHSIGDFVNAGTIVATLENSEEAAAVAQARAGVEQAEANLSKVRGGNRAQEQDILEANERATEQALQNTERSTLSDLRGIFSQANTILRRDIDTFFSSATGVNPHFRYGSHTTSSSQREKVEELRAELRYTLMRWENFSDTITLSNIESSFVTTEEYLNNLLVLADELTLLTQSLRPDPARDFSQSDVADLIEKASDARNSINNLLSTIHTLSTSLETAQQGALTAERQRELGVEGAQSEDILSAEASVSSARANLQAALARLEKTLIRTPVSGEIISLSIDRGDVVSPLESVGFVANQSSLQITVFVSEEERSSIIAGNDVLIEGEIEGVVALVAPGIDPRTNKVEVLIEVEENSNLISGESVEVAIETTSPTPTLSSDEILVPLTALRVTPTREFVLVVREDGVLEERDVLTGILRGESITIEAGLDMGEKILRDARGFRAGDEINTN